MQETKDGDDNSDSEEVVMVQNLGTKLLRLKMYDNTADAQIWGSIYR